MEARCPRCGEKGSYDFSIRVFSCAKCGASLSFEDSVEEFSRVNEEKAPDCLGRGNPTP